MSRAERPPNRRLTLALGTLVVLALALGFWVKLTRPKKARVPLGIAGFELGQMGEGQKRVRTTFIDEPADCTLSFGSGRKLEEIKCSLDAGATPERRRQLRGKMLTTLRQLYGEETRASAAPGLEHWEWANDRALLTLEMPPVLATTGGIEVTNKQRGQ